MKYAAKTDMNNNKTQQNTTSHNKLCNMKMKIENVKCGPLFIALNMHPVYFVHRVVLCCVGSQWMILPYTYVRKRHLCI